MRSRVRWPEAVAVLVTAALLAAVVTVIAGGSARDSVRSGHGTPTPAQQETTLVVLGDELSVESDANSGPEWPRLLGASLNWTVYTEAVDASGYVSHGVDRPFGARIPAVLTYNPDVIIVAGGAADVGLPMRHIAQAADSVLTRLVNEAPDAQVVVVSPAHSGAGPLTEKVSQRIAKIASTHAIPFIDATDWLQGRDRVAEDGPYPTDKGQRLLARRIEQALVEHGVAERPADVGASRS